MNIQFFLKKSVPSLIFGTASLLLLSCDNSTQVSSPKSEPASIVKDFTIDIDNYKNMLITLSSDEFEGRAPSTKGGKKTVTYLSKKMSEIGLLPFDGDYRQNVPLVAITLDENKSMASFNDEKLSYRKDIVFWTKQNINENAFSDSEMVFVGYGVVAPEYGWDDYKGLDVKGKTVVMLINDPGFATKDPASFNGNAMTYYGRWTYKFEEAARQGAKAALIIHETEPASYPWSVVEGSWSGAQLDMISADKGMSRVELEGWISNEKAMELFAANDLDYEEVKATSARSDFSYIDLPNTKFSAKLSNEFSFDNSSNVVGYVKGNKRPNEYVIFTAHWDHLGTDHNEALADRIYNGAVDNATGTAGILSIAKELVKDAKNGNLDRSVIFAAVTAEESGLLGSRYMANNLPVDASKIVAGVNIDAILPTPETSDLVIVGYGSSEMEDLLEYIIEPMGMYLTPDPHPERGYFYRSDHIEFAKVGIPMIYPDPGNDFISYGNDASGEFVANYTSNSYHKPSDEYSEDWDLAGINKFLNVLYKYSYEIANSEAWPNWYSENEFRSIRDASLASE